ncbi:MAG: hypothetical protein IJ565_03165 [Bacilli bacterium]|nr:hypothetical protein [Bacilli bacterium]
MTSTFLENISKDAWLTFIGSIIGGLITMIGVILTIQYEKRVNKINQLKDVRPFIVCKPDLPDVLYSAKDEEEFRTYNLNVKNVSDNLVKDLRVLSDEVYIYVGNDKYEKVDDSKDSRYSIFTVLMDTTEMIEAHNVFSYQTNILIHNYKETSKSPADTFKVKMLFEYTDILDLKKYRHYLEYNLTINYTREKGKYILFANDIKNETIN